ncbi:DNA polymerase III subunit delta [bacterium]|nr:DNA polymerase III subunit delta [bacterium]
MDFEALMRSIEERRFEPVYFFDGEEPFFIDVAMERLESLVVGEAERDFNQCILYGSETDLPRVLEEARRFPMMSDRVLVMVREAQHLRDFKALSSYLAHPQPTTVLVFAHKGKKLDGRTEIARQLKKEAVYYTSEPLRDYQLPAWIKSHATKLGLRIDDESVQKLADHLGTDLGRVDGELRKLSLVMPKGQVVDADLVERYVGISKEFNAFELTRALSNRDGAKAERIVRYAAANPKDLPLAMVIPLLYSYFSKILLLHQSNPSNPAQRAKALGVAPFALKEYELASKHFSIDRCIRAIRQLRTYDGRLKGAEGGATDESQLFRELIWKLRLGA